ncbi:PAS domain S-box protein [Nitrospira sp. Kam-Ns4a]
MLEAISDPAPYHLTGFAVPPLVAGVLIAALGVAVTVRERGTAVSLAFLFVTATAWVWLLSFAWIYSVRDAAVARWWVNVEHLGVAFIPSAILLFALTTVGRVRQSRPVVAGALALSGLFCLSVPTTDWFVTGLREYPWGLYPQYGPLSVPFVLFLLTAMVASARLQWSEFRHRAIGSRQRLVRGLFLAFCVGYLGAVDLLPAYGVPVYPFGFLAVLGFVGLAARAIWRDRLMILTPAVAAGQILDTMQEVVLVVGPEGLIHVANRAVNTTLGYPPADLVGQPISVISPALAVSQPEPAARVQNCEMVWRTRPGELVTVSVSAAPITDRDGRPAGTLFVARDLSERLRMEATLHESERKFRSLLQSAPDAIVIADAHGSILSWNRAAERMFGYSEPEILGKPLTVLMPERYREAHQLGLERLRRTGESRLLGTMLELEGLRQDGREFSLELSLTTWTTGGQAFYGGIIRDITERRQAQAQLERSRTELAEAERLAQLGSWSWDIAANRIHWSDELYRIFGLSPGEFEATFEAYLGRIHPDDREAVRTRIERACRDQAPFAFDHRIVRGDGAIRILQCRGTVVAGCQGQPLSMFGSAQDVTELRQAEEALRKAQEELEIRVRERTAELEAANERLLQQIGERLQAQEALRQSQEELIQARKLEAVGKLAGGIAHEFNNLLTVILGYGELVGKAVTGQTVLADQIAHMMRAAERAASLTQQLLAFGRKQVLQAQVLDLNDLVTSFHQMLARLIGEDVTMALRLEATRAIRADPGQLQQVLLNLVNNARDAMPTGGRLTIATADLAVMEPAAPSHGVPPGTYVTLSVRDTGVGMAPDTQARIFEPFFTTKEVGQGTGLGLSTVYGIVAQSGGHIRVESEPGRGTTFTLYFPAVQPDAPAPDLPAPPAELPTGTETILVVEDEPEIRAIVREVLEPLGYLVLEAERGEEALRLCKQDDRPVHLLLTDVVMPGMTGRELADRLRVRYPQLQVLYISGYTEDRTLRHGILQSESDFLQKPFSHAALARKVRARLDARSAEPS